MKEKTTTTDKYNKIRNMTYTLNETNKLLYQKNKKSFSFKDMSHVFFFHIKIRFIFS